MFEMTAAERAEGVKSWYSRRLRNVRKNRSVGSLLGAFVASVFASSIATGPACSSSGSSTPSSKSTKGAGGSTHRSSDAGAAVAADGAADAGPFEPISPAVYVAKVKNILVSLPPTDDEVNSVTADPSKLAGLIDGWMTLPQYEEKMLVFFELAFQQTQISYNDLADQAYPRQAVVNASTRNLLTQNVRQSFARTVLALIDQGKPFTDVVTTRQFMMTPALMELYAFFDAWQVDDAGKVTDRFQKANPKVSITVEASQGPIPISETLDPSSPNYMHWYDPDLADVAKAGTGCSDDPVVYPAKGDTLHFLLYGSLVGRKSASGATCNQFGGSANAPQLTASDFDTWKMVTIRPPNGSESATPFYDLETLRSSSELVLTIPRIGFFSTPAFFANWTTNTSNQARVTMNQTLIVATGAQVDGTDTTMPSDTPGLDSDHAGRPDCLHCHQLLDPTRSILSSTYSWNYHQQTDNTFSAQKGLFAFEGVQKSLSSVADLADVLTSHPLFGPAWAQKLCYYVNSKACDPNDPELARIVADWKSSGYAWNTLVRELLSSPLTTGAAPTLTTREGLTVAVSRRDHICTALNERLGFKDVCALDVTTTATAAQKAIAPIVAGLPSDGYGRGSVAPVLPNEPTLFYRAGMENICATVSALVIDTPSKSQLPNVKQWSSKDPDSAIADFVSIILALTPSDPRSQPLTNALKSHYTQALGQGATATNALRSTFVVACLSPSAISIGL